MDHKQHGRAMAPRGSPRERDERSVSELLNPMLLAASMAADAPPNDQEAPRVSREASAPATGTKRPAEQDGVDVKGRRVSRVLDLADAPSPPGTVPESAAGDGVSLPSIQTLFSVARAGEAEHKRRSLRSAYVAAPVALPVAYAPRPVYAPHAAYVAVPRTQASMQHTFRVLPPGVHAPAASVLAPAGGPAALQAAGAAQDAQTRRCMNCGTRQTPSWRRVGPEQTILCNACGLYYLEHGQHRVFRIGPDGRTRATRRPKKRPAPPQAPVPQAQAHVVPQRVAAVRPAAPLAPSPQKAPGAPPSPLKQDVDAAVPPAAQARPPSPAEAPQKTA